MSVKFAGAFTLLIGLLAQPHLAAKAKSNGDAVGCITSLNGYFFDLKPLSFPIKE